MDKIEQGWFLDITFRFQHIRDARPAIGDKVLVMNRLNPGDFDVAWFIAMNKGTEDETYEWEVGDKSWPVAEDIWAALPEVEPVIFPLTGYE